MQIRAYLDLDKEEVKSLILSKRPSKEDMGFKGLPVLELDREIVQLNPYGCRGQLRESMFKERLPRG